MQIPAFLLRKLFVKGSLQNTGDGFAFKIKNSLSPGTAVGVDPIKVDGIEYPIDTLTISSADGEVKAKEISAGNAFPIKVGVEITLSVSGAPLAKGTHKIDISLVTKEAGRLAFDVQDEIV
ncbi:MAG: hydroxymethylglutaryl-CoA reductase [Candidatus Thorarchaeota archaeon]|nr:hydroxymethylglutaryl-CoA reductase [Candidatus Thorarchaeota archaeon]